MRYVCDVDCIHFGVCDNYDSEEIDFDCDKCSKFLNDNQILIIPFEYENIIFLEDRKTKRKRIEIIEKLDMPDWGFIKE